MKLWDTQSGTCLRTLRPERGYERMDITGLTGISDAQRTALLALGAVEQHGRAGESTTRSTAADSNVVTAEHASNWGTSGTRMVDRG